MNVTFLDETEICERAVRRLARSRNVSIARRNGTWIYGNGIELDSDEMWDVLSALPVRNRTRYGLL